MIDAVIPIERAVLLSYVLAADLLSACRRERWWDYLASQEPLLDPAEAGALFDDTVTAQPAPWAGRARACAWRTRR